MRPILFSLPILFTPLSAFADDPALASATGPTSSNPVTVGESVVMPAKRGLIRVDVGMNLSSVDDGMGGTTTEIGNPIQIAPDFWYGVDNKLTVGYVHSFVGITGFMGFPFGSGICLGDGCQADYTAAGAVRYQFHQDKKMAWAVDGALLGTLAKFDNGMGMTETKFELAAKLGVVGRYRVSPKLAIDVQPAIFFGITERDAGNKEIFALPITANIAIDKKITVLVQTGFFTPVEADAAGDRNYLVPFTLGAHYTINNQLSVYGAFSLFGVAAGGAISGADGRTFSVGGGYAL